MTCVASESILGVFWDEIVCFVRPGDADSEIRLDVEGPVLHDSLRGDEKRRPLPAYNLAIRNFGFAFEKSSHQRLCFWRVFGC
jgi:hypothetical protein